MSIGLFDSGLGGLSVMRAVRERMPRHDLLYLADSAYCPYGPRPRAEIQDRALACTHWLIEQGAQMVVVACNTATLAAVELLRAQLSVPVVGMEPGLKPAIGATRSGHVAVLATDSTLTSARFEALVERFAHGTLVHEVACPALVGQIERGDVAGPATRALVEGYLAPLRSAGVDVLVLGCTHFPFARQLIAELAGSTMAIIDTGPAVAAQVERVASSANVDPGRATIRCATTGEVATVAPVIARLWRAALPVEQARC